MSGLPSGLDDPGHEFAQSTFFAGHPGHLMIDPVRIRLAPVTNSRPSSRRSGVVSRRSKPFAASETAHILPLAGWQKTPHHGSPSSFPRLPAASPLHLISDPSNKTHRSHALQRFS